MANPLQNDEMGLKLEKDYDGPNSIKFCSRVYCTQKGLYYNMVENSSIFLLEIFAFKNVLQKEK